ncbi:hypothetical protein RM704_20245 [Streptomyces sp. DSM 3412]|uniref:Uncharacterized protein n=1 Tax=Streptomyces gottesmaniae TaxID=3075518 RepID=A0ABU2Z0W1_9ACTN|nr:hypothetical protein [Streptomyces sp. DSM 3412]MDT0569778.1 hypothetical protein [Streptomyces sp. DSM 3412]
MEQGPRTLAPHPASQIALMTLPRPAHTTTSPRADHHTIELNRLYPRSLASSSNPGDQHLFADASLPFHDPAAAALLTRRAIEFLGSLQTSNGRRVV